MKIYNKKVFASGVFMVALGVLNLMADGINHTVDANGLILAAALLLFGFGAIMRSLSKQMAKEDKLEQLDERNRLIDLKSKSRSFQLTQGIIFALMVILLVMGKLSGYEGFVAMGTGLAFAFAISMFTEVFTYAYYESKN